MLLAKVCKLCKVDHKRIHPRFEAFDRVVTILAAIEASTKVWELIHHSPGMAAGITAVGVGMWIMEA